jgi:transcriptional regulator with XRE-family HTH domain
MRRRIDSLVGAKIRGLRESQGLSIEDIAEQLGCGTVRVRAYEAGFARVQARDLMKILRVLQARPADLFDLDPSKPAGSPTKDN